MPPQAIRAIFELWSQMFGNVVRSKKRNEYDTREETTKAEETLNPLNFCILFYGCSAMECQKQHLMFVGPSIIDGYRV